jgi:hypothetical protein
MAPHGRVIAAHGGVIAAHGRVIAAHGRVIAGCKCVMAGLVPATHDFTEPPRVMARRAPSTDRFT